VKRLGLLLLVGCSASAATEGASSSSGGDGGGSSSISSSASTGGSGGHGGAGGDAVVSSSNSGMGGDGGASSVQSSSSSTTTGQGGGGGQGGAACVPETCADRNGECGAFSDGCTGLIDCTCGDLPNEINQILCNTSTKLCECTWAQAQYGGMCASDVAHPYARLCGSMFAADHQIDCVFKQAIGSQPHYVWCCAH
jgi:hypothetical protein